MRRFEIGMAAVVSLVVLRLAIGWLFFAGAWHKYHDRGFSSVPFLRVAKGPLAPLYKQGIPDVHGWSETIETPLEARPEKPPTDDTGHAARKLAEPAQSAEKPIPVADPVYRDWYQRIAEAWGRLESDVAAHFGYDDNQQKQADERLLYYTASLRNYLSVHADDLAGYRYDLHHQAQKKPQPELPVDTYVQERRTKALAVRKWVEETEAEYRKELDSLATPEQRQARGDLPRPEPMVARFDRFLIYTHVAIGACLLLGLFTRLAAFGSALFLLSVVASQPWWAEGALSWISGPQAVMYQVILMLASIVLMTTGAGRWAGLDYFIDHRRELLSSKPEGA